MILKMSTRTYDFVFFPTRQVWDLDFKQVLRPPFCPVVLSHGQCVSVDYSQTFLVGRYNLFS